MAHRRLSTDGSGHRPAFADVVSAVLNDYEAHSSTGAPHTEEEKRRMSPLLSPHPPPTVIGGEPIASTTEGQGEGSTSMGSRVAEPACVFCPLVLFNDKIN